MKASDYALIDAARHGLLDEVKKLSKDCVDIGVGYYLKGMALQSAASIGHLEIGWFLDNFNTKYFF